jgi:integrase
MARGGSIFERTRADGSTSHVVMYRVAGRQVKVTVRGGRREAQRVLTAALAARDRGELPAVTTITFGEYAERWLAEHRPRIEAATAVDYANVLRNHLLPFFGSRKLRAMKPEHVREYVAAKADGTAPIAPQPPGQGGRIKRKLSSKSINNSVTLLGTILGHAHADWLIGSNPARGDRRRPLKLKMPHRERDYLWPGEVPVYLDACSAFWRPRALTLILTGMRIGELLALRWEDVDWNGGAIIVRRAQAARRRIDQGGRGWAADRRRAGARRRPTRPPRAPLRARRGLRRRPCVPGAARRLRRTPVACSARSTVRRSNGPAYAAPS